MSVIAANKKKADENVVKGLAVERTGVTKHDKQRRETRYAQYADGAKGLVKQ